MNKIIRQYLVLTGAFNFAMSLTLATYVTFLITRGLNLFEVNLVNVVFFVTMFFWEIPTGAFADTFGRKRSYVISCFLFAVGMLVYSQSYTMMGFVIAEMLAGIGRTFANGAYHAWFVDTLKHHGYKGTTAPLFRKEQLVRQFVSIPGAIIGAYIASIDISYPWLVGGLLSLIVCFIALISMKEEYFKPTKFAISTSLGDMMRTASEGMRFARKSSTVRFIIMMNVLLAFAVQAPNMQWQPFLSYSFKNTAWLGYVWAGIAIAIFVGIHLSLTFKRLFKNESIALAAALVFTGLTLVCAVATKEYVLLSLAFFLIHEIPRGIYGPIKDAYLNDSIDEKQRATVISCQSVFSHLACLLGLLVSGFIAETYSIGIAWIISGSLLVFIPFILLRRRKSPTEVLVRV